MKDVKCIGWDDTLFPQNLKKLKDCPKQLFVIGDEKILNDFSLAVIGARNCSKEGARIAEEITAGLTRAGVNIVSGLALGIDSVAHEECINQNGKTIAVLGGGFENIYPKQHIKLYEKIIEKGGAIVSEYPPDAAPLAFRFRLRNRIIAALSAGVVVIEAREKSGSQVTVKYAKELGKDIFIVPGSVYDPNYIRKQ